jgi:titin
MTGFAVAPAGASVGSVSGTGICFGDPASGGCSFFGSGSTTAIAGSTEEFGAALTATDGVSTGQQIVLDGTGTGMSFSGSLGDYDVINHSNNFECKAASVSLSNSGQTASVTMPSGCAATAGSPLAVLAFNTVLPGAPGTLSLSLSTTADPMSVGTNSLSLVTLPSAPKNASASRALQSIIVAWSAPDSLGDPALTGYNVYCSTGTPNTADTPSANTDAATTSATISGLAAHTTYNCVVTAVNTGGQSDASNLVSAVPYERPDAPSGVSTAAGDQTVTLFWSAPQEVGGTPITAYHAYCSTTYPPTVGAGDLCGTFGPAKRSGVIRGLANGVAIYVGMTAVNTAGESILSGIGNPTPTGPPARPWEFRAKPFHQSIELRWKVPTSDGGDPITGYDVYCSVDDPPTVTGSPSATSATNDVRVHGLTTGTPYYCVVFAVNTRGRSHPSFVVTATPL